MFVSLGGTGRSLRKRAVGSLDLPCTLDPTDPQELRVPSAVWLLSEDLIDGSGVMALIFRKGLSCPLDWPCGFAEPQSASAVHLGPAGLFNSPGEGMGFRKEGSCTLVWPCPAGLFNSPGEGMSFRKEGSCTLVWPCFWDCPEHVAPSGVLQSNHVVEGGPGTNCREDLLSADRMVSFRLYNASSLLLQGSGSSRTICDGSWTRKLEANITKKSEGSLEGNRTRMKQCTAHNAYHVW